MTRLGLLVLGLAAVAALPLAAQQPAPTFVASIKPTRGDTPGASFASEPGGRFTMTNAPIRGLIVSAYPIESGEVIGAPDWVLSDRYDVTVKAEGDPSREAMRMILQALLKDRLKLAARYESQERPVYFLTLARTDGRLGPQLRQTTLDCDAIEATQQQGQQRQVKVLNDAPVCGLRVAGGRFTANGISLPLLTTNLRSRVGRVVIDKTGLTGRYDLSLVFAARPDDPDQPSVFTALEEQLGLKLENGRAPLQVLVIDRIERPTPD
jgi:uncharacterized protein (TIGR03435 family)